MADPSLQNTDSGLFSGLWQGKVGNSKKKNPDLYKVSGQAIWLQLWTVAAWTPGFHVLFSS
jgi:hypothetical protein